jgi:hypothetical protein
MKPTDYVMSREKMKLAILEALGINVKRTPVSEVEVIDGDPLKITVTFMLTAGIVEDVAHRFRTGDTPPRL